MTRIGVAVPVGPLPHHAQWLPECIDSVLTQTHSADHLLIVDDMAGIEEPYFSSGERWLSGTRVAEDGGPFIDIEVPVNVVGDLSVYQAPWLLGVATAFNFGVSLLHADGCDLVLMLGADDRIEPECLAAIEATYERYKSREGYYWLDVIYSDGREQAVRCNAAAVTPGIWRKSGGLPVWAERRAPDSVLISAMYTHMPNAFVHVKTPRPYYWHRVHEGQETRRRIPASANQNLRDWYSQTWTQPEWGRFQ